MVYELIVFFTFLNGWKQTKGKIVLCDIWRLCEIQVSVFINKGYWATATIICLCIINGCFHFHSSLLCIEEGHGSPLQCFCLENPRDGGAWWAAIYGVAQSRTRLKQLSSSSSRSYKMDGTWGSLNHWVEEGHLPIRISALDFFFFFGKWDLSPYTFRNLRWSEKCSSFCCTFT